MSQPAVIKKKRRRLEAFDVLVFVLLTFYAVLIIFPFYTAILGSFVSSQTYTLNPLLLYPKDPILDNYRYLFNRGEIQTGYVNTLIITCLGTVYALFISTTMAYALSKKSYPGKRFFFIYMIIPMFFSGGLVPIYLNIKNLGLINSLASIILMLGVTPFNIIILKNGFEAIPESVEEAARIDGATDVRIFWQIALPLSSATLATITLFILVAYWNEWYWSMLLINKGTKFPLQVVLRSIVNEAASDFDLTTSVGEESVFSFGIKMAAVMLTMLPVMVAYPFLQKYFAKGAMVGAVKM